MCCVKIVHLCLLCLKKNSAFEFIFAACNQAFEFECIENAQIVRSCFDEKIRANPSRLLRLLCWHETLKRSLSFVLFKSASVF